MTDTTTQATIGHLAVPSTSAAAQALFDEDLADAGFVMNASRLWAYQPELITGLFDLMSRAIAMHEISFRRRGVIVAACASTLGDSYCSLAWGSKLASVSSDDVAAGVLTGGDAGLSDNERALAVWARKVAADPSATTHGDVQELRRVGYTDAQIFAITVFIGLRMTLSTVNDALGIGPDAEYGTMAPQPVRDAVAFGRAIDAEQPDSSHARSHGRSAG